MLFTSALCANVCSESLVACLGVLVEAVVAFCRTLRP